MLRSRFLWKIYGGYAVLILVTAGLVGLLVKDLIERETLAEVDLRLELEARLLRTVVKEELERSDGTLLERRVRELGRELGTRFSVIAADGVVLADSAADPARMDNHGTRPEVLLAAAEGRGLVSRFSRTTQRRMHYLALPMAEGVPGDGAGTSPGGGVSPGAGVSPGGFVRTALPLTVLEERLDQLFRKILLGVSGAALVALFIGFLMARRVTRPLLLMAATAESIAQGAYARRVPVTSRDELGQLAAAMNTMNEALRDSMATISADRNKLTAILGGMVEGVIAVDHDERVMHMNQVAGRLLRVEPEEAVERPIWEVVRSPELSEILSKTLRQKELGHRVVQLAAPVDHGAADRFLELYSSPLRGDDDSSEGTPAGAVLVLHDVTQLRRLETVRRDFVGNVSHELKTPVAAIRGLVETLVDDPEIAPDLRQRFLGRIARQTERLSSLVTDLLALSRLESEDRFLEHKTLDVRETLHEAVNAHQPAAEERGVTVVEDWRDAPLEIEGEEEALLQAVGNLLSNAVKYAAKDGRVVVRARQESREKATWIVIELEDDGPGIEPRHHTRIFERFYRVDAARSRELGGTGLGLAIVKHVARSFGGEVELESISGEGSIFRMRLPAAGSGK